MTEPDVDGPSLMSRVASAYRSAADSSGTTKGERDRWLAIAEDIEARDRYKAEHGHWPAPNPD